ncbi:hypothetical protein [Halobacterium wangiae]|uniref:hypothetical protein n=1 Tax=Halobacterium wangiae TaxID=2902623 RepID=UPI001E2EE4B7|nr:hypothetical protein [Halobacterium wangiae]
MDDIELGQATIVYEDEDGVVEETVDNEQLVYARDHWMIKSGTDDEGNDLMQQIPATRVYRVSRNVERFEEETQTMRHRVETFASDLRERLPMDIGEGDRRSRRSRSDERDEEPTTVPIEEADSTDRA